MMEQSKRDMIMDAGSFARRNLKALWTTFEGAMEPLHQRS